MSDAPERIFACYDPAFDATYWVDTKKVYPTRHSVVEYIRADKVAALVEAARDATLALASHEPYPLRACQSLVTALAALDANP